MPEPNPMQGVVPYIALAGRTAEAMDFYARAFGAEDIGRMPFFDGSPGVMHGQVLINGGALMMTDSGMNPGGAEVRAIQPGFGHLQLVVEDGRMWWDRAIAAGCTELIPYARQPWGDDWGMVQDPFGLKWGIMQDGAAEETSHETPASVVLTSQCMVTAPVRVVWAALTTPALMQRWMLVQAAIVPDASLAPGSRVEWRDADQSPYMVGTVTACDTERRLTVELQDCSWSRPARAGEVTWSFELTEADGVVRIDYRLGDLAIDHNAKDWLEAYRDADEPARLAAVVRELVS